MSPGDGALNLCKLFTDLLVTALTVSHCKRSSQANTCIDFLSNSLSMDLPTIGVLFYQVIDGQPVPAGVCGCKSPRPAHGGIRSVQLEGDVKGRWTRFTPSLPEMQPPAPKSGPAEQLVGVGMINPLSLEESLPGSVPDIPSTASASLLIPSFSAVEELPHPISDVATFLW